MRALKIIGYILILGLTFYSNSYYWSQELPKVLFEGQPVPIEAVNEHTYQGISLIFLIFIFIYALVGRYFTTLFIANGMMFLFYFANKTKYMERGEVVNFNELKLIFSLRELNNLVDLKVITLFVIASMFIIALTFFIETKIYKKIQLPKLLILRVVLFISVIASGVYIAKDSEEFVSHYFKVEKPKNFVFLNERELKRVGVIPNFVLNISREYMEKPKDYSMEKIKEIEKKYENQSKSYNEIKENDITQERTLVYLSESLWQDHSLIENALPAPFIERMQNEYGGQMRTLFIGGGTANIEFEVLTSTDLELHKNPIVTTPYVDYFGKTDIHSSFLTLVNQNAVIHPYHLMFYNRPNVYEKMDIKTIISQEEMEDVSKINTRITDSFLNKELFNALFDFNIINTMSMQNHSPYRENTLKDEVSYVPQYTKDLFVEGKENLDEVNHLEKADSFFRQLVVTDQAIEELVEFMDESNEKINLVFYGDHGPNFLKSTEKELGDSIYRTPYFIYKNQNRNENVESPVLDPMFLIPKLLADGNYKVTPYYYLLTELYKNDITGVTINAAYIGDELVEDNKIDSDILELINDYRIISYNRYFDKKGLNEDFFEKQY